MWVSFRGLFLNLPQISINRKSCPSSPSILKQQFQKDKVRLIENMEAKTRLIQRKKKGDESSHNWKFKSEMIVLR